MPDLPIDPNLVVRACSYDIASGWSRDPTFATITYPCLKCDVARTYSTMVVESNQSNDHRIICLHCGHIKKEF